MGFSNDIHHTTNYIPQCCTELIILLVDFVTFIASLELPCIDEGPWEVDETEITEKGRRDLRHTHLIMSIDPKGCEDVDDALSIR